MKQITKSVGAETFLNLFVASVLIGIPVVGAASFYIYMQLQDQKQMALQTGADLGAASAAARAADEAARRQAANAEQPVPARAADAAAAPAQVVQAPRRPDEVGKHLDQSRQLLAKHGLPVASLEDAGRLQGRLAEQAELRLRRLAAGEPVGAPAEKWIPIAPRVEEAVQQHAASFAQQSASETKGVAIYLVVMVVLGIAVVLTMRAWIRNSNLRPLKAATRMIEQVAAGDLTVESEGMDDVQTRKMAAALDHMAASLRTLAAEVALGARTVADTCAQIAQGNLDLSQRTEEQASTLEETASSMEQLTSTVAQNADHARQASELAVGASDVARKGGQVVGQVVSTMTDISRSSRKIGDIIGVIDGIAFQTNILALNAAVEAARAGEQGRGFAVVAAEVRNLAQRSAAAAKEIKTLIGDSVTKVEAGTKLVDAAGKTMDEIVASVKKVSDLIADIAAASQEQSAGIGQVNTAVAQMEQVVQQNASLVEEASAATESMKDQASALLRAVARFRVGELQAQAAEVAQLQPARTPPPITVRPSSTALPPAFAAIPRKPRAATGDWEEF